MLATGPGCGPERRGADSSAEVRVCVRIWGISFSLISHIGHELLPKAEGPMPRRYGPAPVKVHAIEGPGAGEGVLAVRFRLLGPVRAESTAGAGGHWRPYGPGCACRASPAR